MKLLEQCNNFDSIIPYPLYLSESIKDLYSSRNAILADICPNLLATNPHLSDIPYSAFFEPNFPYYNETFYVLLPRINHDPSRYDVDFGYYLYEGAYPKYPQSRIWAKPTTSLWQRMMRFKNREELDAQIWQKTQWQEKPVLLKGRMHHDPEAVLNNHFTDYRLLRVYNLENANSSKKTGVYALPPTWQKAADFSH